MRGPREEEEGGRQAAQSSAAAAGSPLRLRRALSPGPTRVGVPGRRRGGKERSSPLQGDALRSPNAFGGAEARSEPIGRR